MCMLCKATRIYWRLELLWAWVSLSNFCSGSWMWALLKKKRGGRSKKGRSKVEKMHRESRILMKEQSSQHYVHWHQMAQQCPSHWNWMPLQAGLAAAALVLPWAKPTVSGILQKGLWGSKSGEKLTQPLLATPNSQYRTMSRVHLCLSSTSEIGPLPKDSPRVLKAVQILQDTISANHSGKTKVQLICTNIHKDSSGIFPLAIAPVIYFKKEKSLRMHKSDLRCFKGEWRSYHDQ